MALIFHHRQHQKINRLILSFVLIILVLSGPIPVRADVDEKDNHGNDLISGNAQNDALSILRCIFTS